MPFQIGFSDESTAFLLYTLYNISGADATAALSALPDKNQKYFRNLAQNCKYDIEMMSKM